MSQPSKSPLRVAAFVFPGFQALDLFGPLDILNTLSLEHPIELSIVAESLDPVSTEVQSGQVSQSIVPTHTPENAPTDLDLFMIPGGAGSLKVKESGVDYIRQAYKTTKTALSICTGARLFARAGLLDGRRATTNKNAFYNVTSYGPKTYWVAEARWIKDGNVWTSAGVTAGIDAMLAWVEERYGAKQAADAAEYLEFNRTTDSTVDPFASVYGLKDVPPTA